MRMVSNANVTALECVIIIQAYIVGCIRMSASSAINRLTSKINNVIIVGDDLGKRPCSNKWHALESYSNTTWSSYTAARRPEYVEAAMRYLYYAGACEEILQFTPEFLIP